MKFPLRKILVPVVLSLGIQSTLYSDVTEYVDPTIGNVSKLLVPTFPTFHLPNQMVRMVPGRREHREDQIDHFPLQVYAHRFSGVFKMKVGVGEVDKAAWRNKMTFDHALEVMHPWLYSTYLLDEDISVSFTPSKKSAVFKIDFPAGAEKYVLIAGQGDLEIGEIAGNKVSLKETTKYKVRGVEPTFRYFDTYCYLELTDEQGKPLSGAEIKTGKNRLQIDLSKDAPQTILFKYAISYISHEQAKQNFAFELIGKQFDDVVAEGKRIWTDTLSQIEVKGGTGKQKRTFYTSLYRTYERMVDINEYGHYYSGYDNQVHKTARPFYVDDWIWDSYLAHHPLRTILNPKMQNDVLNSYALMYAQSGGLPTFPQVHGNHLCMFAYHSGTIFLDGYRKGLRDYDLDLAYEGIKKNLTDFTAIPWRQGHPRHALDDFYHENGFYPALHPGEKEPYPLVDGFEKRQSVAITLGMSYDAWVAAELAKTLDRLDDYEMFSQKADNYKNLWHAEQRLFMPKDEKGEWININPKLDGGPGYRDYYDENNGWTYAWYVQHDLEGLVDLLGGRKAAEKRLDQLFRESLGVKRRDFFVDGSNSTGLIGQFSMGNEPSFHIPYLYNYFGAPWKTQRRTRYLLDVWFQDTYHGIPGDEDGGGMTAFVVLSSMGIYQVNPAAPTFTITSPVFEEVSVDLQNGKTFTVEAPGASRQNQYIQKAFLNGKELASPFITYDQIMAGGTLRVELSNRPNKEWGSGPVPFAH